jgi:hypothetical protein
VLSLTGGEAIVVEAHGSRKSGTRRQVFFIEAPLLREKKWTAFGCYVKLDFG